MNYRAAVLLPRRYFRDFVAGRAGETIQVATLASDVGYFISAQTNRVMMGRSYAQKLLVKHRLTYEHFLMVQSAIDNGYCFQGLKQNHMELVYFDRTLKQNAYLLVLKSARWGQEVWLVSFHRTKSGQFKAKRRRQKLLREHL